MSSRRKAPPSPPRVFIEVDLMPGEDPLEFREALASAKSKLEFIRLYLACPGVIRGTTCHPISADDQRVAVQFQQRIDFWLREVLLGIDPAEVFSDPEASGPKADVRKNQAMAFETIRLIREHGTRRAAAIERVADAFATSSRNVERALARWGNRGESLDTFEPLNLYIVSLRAKGLPA